MALTDTRVRTLKARQKPLSQSDGGGLFIEVTPNGGKNWRLRYRLNSKQEKVTLGDYPAYSLAEARQWRGQCKALAARGLSPMALKRGDPIPDDTKPEVKELARTFVRDWRPKATAKEAGDTVEAWSWRWYEEVAKPNNSNPSNLKRVLERDVIPIIGGKHIAEVSVSDVLVITDMIKARGADQSALLARNVIKRLYGYAIARQKATFNPVAAVEARFIAQARSRDVALTSEEIGKLLRAIYSSSMRRAHKLALHLLIICMVRKSELLEARWEEIDFDQALWAIPKERMKKDRPHLVPLSLQAAAMFEELGGLASHSEWVFPSRGSLKKPIAPGTLNVAVRALDLDVRDFVIHDFRRTASTHLHEAGFDSDWIEKALAHETKGIRGVYNRAQYADQRRDMLQWWADFVDAQIEEAKVIIGRFGKTYRTA
ncbi:MAG: tyrosine-type recombinase/integrase [Gammaproteobacteria bacterium]